MAGTAQLLDEASYISRCAPLNSSQLHVSANQSYTFSPFPEVQVLGRSSHLFGNIAVLHPLLYSSSTDILHLLISCIRILSHRALRSGNGTSFPSEVGVGVYLPPALRVPRYRKGHWMSNSQNDIFQPELLSLQVFIGNIALWIHDIGEMVHVVFAYRKEIVITWICGKEWSFWNRNLRYN